MTTEQAREALEKQVIRAMLLRRLNIEFKLLKNLSPSSTTEFLWNTLRMAEEGGN